MFSLRVLVLSLFAITAVVAAGVAPGDEEVVLCPMLRGLGTTPTPDYDPTMRVLMDSWNYQNLLGNRSGAVWQQVDNDVNNPVEFTTNWIQQTNTPCQQFAQVCGFRAGMQSNWLITQLINRTVNDGTRLPQVSVLIEFELRGCDVTLNCQRTFNTHVLEMSVVDPAAASITANYRQVSRVSPDITTGERVNETVHVNFNTNNSSFYFAVQDETSCIVITRMLVFYTVCPKNISDLIHYPETLAPTGSLPITVTASCVENAKPELENGRPLSVICSSSGVWTTAGKRCRCSPGHLVNEAGTCSPCPVGTYLSPSNGSCLPCPANSFSERPGLAKCNCSSGHYRARTGEEDLPCRQPPSPPRGLMVEEVTDNSITVTWSPSAYSAAGNLTYKVYTSFEGRPRIEVSSVETSGTRARIQNLISGVTYTVYVSSSNNITDQVPDEKFNTIAASIQATTLGGGPQGLALALGVSLPVVFVIIVIIVLVSLFLIWVYRKVNDDGGKQLYAQYQTVVELTEQSGRRMYVDPSIYASAEDAIRDFAMEIPPKYLTIKEEIGRGEFGAVYKGIWKNAGKQVAIAIKTLKPNSSAKQRNDFLSEASIMGQFNHPNVVKLYGVVTRVEPVMIIMEFLENGSLFYYLRKNDESLGVQRLLKMARGVAVGMDYLSTIGFVHRDLAARNVLVSKNETCKVADFGLSRETVDDIYKVNKGGKIPVRWTAPEAIYRRKFTTSSDVWSFGVLFWEIMSYGQNPYDDMDNQELLDKIDDGYRLEKPDKTPDEVYQLMLDCWDEDNVKRPTFAIIAQRVDELLLQFNDNNVKPATKKVSKTYSYSSSVVTSPLDYMTVDEWLDGLKMGTYKEHFQQRGISTTNEVLALDEEQLKKMGITLKGHISKIVRSIAIGNQKLGREPSMRI